MPELSSYLKLCRGGFQLDAVIQAPANQVTALFGPSGSGKTTILRCIAGLEQAQEAFVDFQGECWQDTHKGIFLPPHQRSIGYVFQQANLFSHLSVKDNLLYGYKRLSPKQQRIKPEQAIALLGVGHLLQRKPQRLSGGEKQRVAIARALLVSPSLLLMDEPLSALDTQAKHEILPYLQRLHEQLTLTVIYVSHALSEVVQLADHMILLKQGKRLASGKPSELMSRNLITLEGGDQAGVLIDCKVVQHNDDLHVSYVEYSGGRLCIARQALEIGAQMKLRIGAKDISLSLAAQNQSSVLNQTQGCITELDADNAGQVFVRVDVNGQVFVACIHQHACQELALYEGQRVHVQINKFSFF